MDSKPQKHSLDTIAAFAAGAGVTGALTGFLGGAGISALSKLYYGPEVGAKIGYDAALGSTMAGVLVMAFSAIALSQIKQKNNTRGWAHYYGRAFGLAVPILVAACAGTYSYDHLKKSSLRDDAPVTRVTGSALQP